MLLSLFLAFSDAQVQYCNEFLSPAKLVARTSVVDLIRLPLKVNLYSRNQLCEWIIECKEGEIIQLEVLECSIQDRDIYGECNKDYVNVFDVQNGESHFMQRFCGTNKGMIYRSTGTTMIIRFISDNVYEYKGFRMSYTAKSAETSDGMSSDFKVQLGVGIPVGVLLAVTITLFIVFIYCQHRKRRRNQANSSNNAATTPALSSHLWSGTGTNAPSSFAIDMAPPSSRGGRTVGRGPPAWGSYRGQGIDPGLAQGFPLQVSLPSDLEDDEGDARGRSSPPPAYESLGYVEQPMTPPPYETVVKESEEHHC